MPKAPAAYYSEIDPKAAATLRELIKYGIIADGDVDERSIEDVTPIELAGYTQRHFFAGFGVWSYALRNAGWPDSRPVVTGSCPCQPFSAAGKGEGFTDERHLWPALFWHIRFGRPCPVFGEQVASSDGLTWLDSVSADLEATSHTIAAVDLCSAGFGSPNIRQRLYWMAHPANGNWRGGVGGAEEGVRAGREWRRGSPGCGSLDGLVDSLIARLEGHAGDGDRGNGRTDQAGSTTPTGASGRVGDTSSGGRGELRDEALAGSSGYPDGAVGPSLGMADAGDGQIQEQGRRSEGRDGTRPTGPVHLGGSPGPTNGFWRDADWLFCRDGRWRPVESGTSPLAHGAPERMGRLRGYGNALNAIVAEEFIKACIGELDAI